MFCPKCGTQNIEGVRFCRNCGVALSIVNDAISGNLPAQQPLPTYIDRKGRVRSNDPDQIYSAAIRNLVMGMGFLVISILLAATGVAGGHSWWWAMLFPAFASLSNGVSQMAKVRRLEKYRNPNSNVTQNQFPSSQPNATLPPQQTSYVNDFSSSELYKTGDLVMPPSVTENTTRHLEINKEAETMTLPKI